MNKNFSLLAVILLYTGPTRAKEVPAAAAQQVAANFISMNTKFQQPDLKLSYTEMSSSGMADYYVFSLNNNTGFVIISAEDAGYPVIGYSTESAFEIPAAGSNSNFIFWMQRKKDEIEYIRKHSLAPTVEISGEWNSYLTGKTENPKPMVVPAGPLCLTKWNQYNGGSVPYNAMCPGGSWTGCVATTMAQIMKKWAYPATGTGSHSYNAGSYGTLSANFGATTYNWANMPNTSSNSNVATIMYHCGVSVEMAYSPSGSGAGVSIYDSPICAQTSFVNFFGYDPGIHVEFMDSVASTSVWIQMLENEFAAGRPVQYFGIDVTNGGHSWVCDGNDASHLMHMNWGWSGTYDGNFSVTNLHPGSSNFTTYIGGLLGIEPKVSTGIAPLSDEVAFTIYPNPASSTVAVKGTSTSISVHYSLCNVLGKEIRKGDIVPTGNTFSGNMEVSGLPAGMYFLTIRDGERQYTQKLNKQ